MVTATTHTQSYPSHHDNWKQQEDVITSNDVIDAYFKGKQAGKDEANIAMIKLFGLNLGKAQEASEQLYGSIKAMGFSVNSIHLKADNITNFMALLVTDVNDYVSEGFLDAIAAGRELKNRTDTEDFTINFYFTYQADTLNEHSLDSDGYFLKYNGNK
jgi:hypothetical protein